MGKVSHREAGYHEGHGPNGSHCSICRFFEVGKPVHCQRVVDPIRADDGCRLFQQRRVGKLSTVRDGSSMSRRSISGSDDLTVDDFAVKLTAKRAKLHGDHEPIELDDVAPKKGNRKHWGYHLLLDMDECNEDVDNPLAIKSFFGILLKELKLKPLSEVVLRQVEKGGEQGRGTSATQIITTSTITFHGDDEEWSVYLDVFICNPYNPQKVIDLVEQYFEPKHIGVQRITRDAGKYPER